MNSGGGSDGWGSVPEKLDELNSRPVILWRISFCVGRAMLHDHGRRDDVCVFVGELGIDSVAQPRQLFDEDEALGGIGCEHHLCHRGMISDEGLEIIAPGDEVLYDIVVAERRELLPCLYDILAEIDSNVRCCFPLRRLVLIFEHVRVGINFVNQAIPGCDYDLVHL